MFYSYIYTDELVLKPELVMPIIYASEKYMIPGLTEVCRDYLEKELCTHACIFYDHSLLFKDGKLEERCLALIKSGTKACFQVPSMLYIRRSTLSKILDSDGFRVSETDLFSACEKWARYQVQKVGEEVNGTSERKMLGDCVAKIRYPTMTAEELGTHVTPTGILLPDEELAVFRFVSNKGGKVARPMFNGENRLLKGPFCLLYSGETAFKCLEYEGKFLITCNQNISVKKFIIGSYEYKWRTEGTMVFVDNAQYECNTVDANAGTALELTEAITLNAQSTHILQIIHIIQQYWDKLDCKIKCRISDKYILSDNKSGICLSVTTKTGSYLLGVEYDYT